MVKINSLLKKMWMVLAILLCSVVSAQAANITYSLTTHVDGRTITGTANLAEGASLQDNMPQALWRGYTTYKYYSDEALTQEITTAPAEDATVYVDYEFDPPFQMSNDNKTVWNYMRNYVLGGSTQRIVYYERGYIRTERSSLADKDKHEQHWAFYGDGYDFKVKSRLTNVDNPWLVWTSGSGVELGAEPSVGWQLYDNAASTTRRPGGTVCLGRPDNAQLLHMADLGSNLTTQNINTSNHKFDSHNQLVALHGNSSSSQATMERQELWLYAFFAAPSASSQDIWHVTYKIQKADGTWYDDIVIQKSSSNLTPSFPPTGFKPVEGYEYDYFYTDATFTEKFQGAMPNDCNTTLYIKETAPVEPVIYYVTYKIQQADGTWYEDIVKEKDPNNLTPAFPAEYTQKEGYTYDYFYKDENFTEKCAEDYTMPADENTILFIKETAPVYTVTYKILQADGNWYEDIVKEKDPNNLTPAFPSEEYSMKDGCEYDYFYQDATFQEKFEGDMPANENTVLYIKEKVIEYVSEPWKTLVIPFGIENLASFFGEDFEGVPAVDVLEFQGIEDGVVTHTNGDDLYRCKLIFNPVYFIEAYKPYLIRLNRAYKSARDEMYAAEKGERDCEVTTVADPANAGISVTMIGTLSDEGYAMNASDGLHFYFGYDDRANAYNFYRVSAQIPRNRCWFYVVDERPAGAKLNVTFDMDAITGIGQVVSAKATDGRIYNINGQQVQGTLQKGIYIVNGKKVIVK